MASAKPPDGPRGPDKGIQGIPWYKLDGCDPPRLATGPLLLAIVGLLKEEFNIRQGHLIASGNFNGTHRMEAMSLGEPTDPFSLTLEMDTLWSAKADTLTVRRKVGEKQTLLTVVRTVPGDIDRARQPAPKIASIQSYLDSTNQSGQPTYHMEGLKLFDVDGDFLIAFLRENSARFNIPDFENRLAALEQLQKPSEDREVAEILKGAERVVTEQRQKLEKSGAMLKKAGRKHARLLDNIDNLKSGRTVRNIIIGTLLLLVATGIIDPAGCQKVHDVVTGKGLKDNGAEKAGGSGRAKGDKR